MNDSIRLGVLAAIVTGIMLWLAVGSYSECRRNGHGVLACLTMARSIR